MSEFTSSRSQAFGTHGEVAKLEQVHAAADGDLHVGDGFCCGRGGRAGLGVGRVQQRSGEAEQR